MNSEEAAEETVSAWISLDFRGQASLADRMDDITRDQIRQAFAALTAEMEDAAALAVEGQSAALAATRAAELIRELDLRLRAGGASLAALTALIS